jgi:5-enolpyruvylshikimate-3-phosphate synthase
MFYEVEKNYNNNIERYKIEPDATSASYSAVLSILLNQPL